VIVATRLRGGNATSCRGAASFAAASVAASRAGSPFTTLQAAEHHRDHAQIEQLFADLAEGPVAHLPSGSFPANAAWLACAVSAGAGR
jgi:hypothetical protein